jgi:hypothetical protein
VNDDDELTQRRGKGPKPVPPRKPPKKSKTAAEKRAHDNQITDALYFLTPRELRWVQHVAAGVPRTEAVRLAGWRSDGDRARMRSWRLMQKPIIRAALHQLSKEAMMKAGIENAQIVREYADLAFRPDFMLDGLPRWADKMAALNKLAEIAKLIDKTTPKSGDTNIIALITASMTPKTAPIPSEVIVHEPALQRPDAGGTGTG